MNQESGHEKAHNAQDEFVQPRPVGGDTDSIFDLCDQVRGTAFAIHRYLRHGHMGKAYENAPAHRLRKQRLLILSREKAQEAQKEDSAPCAAFCGKDRRAP